MGHIANLTKTFGQYKKNNDGATAIEFAILILPFSALLFAIIELAIVFFIQSTLVFATTDVSRQIRTGQFQASCAGVDEFRDQICDNLAGFSNCSDNLSVEVIRSTTGQFDVALTPPPNTPDPSDPGEPMIVPDQFEQSGPGDVVVVRSLYYHQLAFPTEFTRLSNQPGNQRVILATTAFRNEPFPNSTCP